MQNERIIIRDEVYEGQEDPLDCVRELLANSGAFLVDQTGFFVQDKPRYEKWIFETSNIFLVDDSLIGASYVILNSNILSDIAQAIKKKINYISLNGELQYHKITLDKLSSEKDLTLNLSNEEYATFIQRFALLHETYDEKVYYFFENALFHALDDIRMTTLFAFHYAWWPELKPLVEKVSREDDNEVIKRFAADFISYYDQPEPGVFMQSEHVPHWWVKCKKYQSELYNLQNNISSDNLSEEDLDDLPPFFNF